MTDQTIQSAMILLIACLMVFAFYAGFAVGKVDSIRSHLADIAKALKGIETKEREDDDADE